MLGSSALDMAMGAISKDRVSAKNFRRIRSRVRTPDNDGHEEPLPEEAPDAE